MGPETNRALPCAAESAHNDLSPWRRPGRFAPPATALPETRVNHHDHGQGQLWSRVTTKTGGQNRPSHLGRQSYQVPIGIRIHKLLHLWRINLDRRPTMLTGKPDQLHHARRGRVGRAAGRTAHLGADSRRCENSRLGALLNIWVKVLGIGRVRIKMRYAFLKPRKYLRSGSDRFLREVSVLVVIQTSIPPSQSQLMRMLISLS